MSTTRLEFLLLGIGFLLLTVLFVYGSLLYFAQQVDLDSIIPVIMGAGLVFLPTIALLVYYKYTQAIEHEVALRTQEEKIRLQADAIDALREQRHDMLNELALISMYIQLGRNDDALRCLNFTAANLSDKYNLCALPTDAWTTIVEAKRAEAERLGIDFQIEIEGVPPASLNERILLPKLIANLLDNAFEATKDQVNGRVVLRWRGDEKARTLSVENNGQPVPPEQLQDIFLPGYTSKTGEGRGWGLTICQKIAAELGGELTVSSNKEYTTFKLTILNGKK